MVGPRRVLWEQGWCVLLLWSEQHSSCHNGQHLIPRAMLQTYWKDGPEMLAALKSSHGNYGNLVWPSAKMNEKKQIFYTAKPLYVVRLAQVEAECPTNSLALKRCLISIAVGMFEAFLDALQVFASTGSSNGFWLLVFRGRFHGPFVFRKAWSCTWRKEEG